MGPPLLLLRGPLYFKVISCLNCLHSSNGNFSPFFLNSAVLSYSQKLVQTTLCNELKFVDRVIFFFLFGDLNFFFRCLSDNVNLQLMNRNEFGLPFIKEKLEKDELAKKNDE